MNADVEGGAASELAAIDTSDLSASTGVIYLRDVRRSL